MEKIVDAVARNVSLRDAAGALAKQAGLPISVTEVARIALEIGRELQAKQEQRARQYARRELPGPVGPPPVWMTDCWQGRVPKVLEEMKQWQERLGPATEDGPDEPAETLRRAVVYLEHNAARMDYPSYRRQGLPITSCLVESLIKQLNQRVKGSDKFWNRPEGAEAILQLRAAFLSDGDVLDTHLRSRPGCAYYRRSRPASLKTRN